MATRNIWSWTDSFFQFSAFHNHRMRQGGNRGRPNFTLLCRQLFQDGGLAVITWQKEISLNQQFYSEIARN